MLVARLKKLLAELEGGGEAAPVEGAEPGAMDNPPPTPGTPPPPAMKKEEDMVSKPAMDAAIAKATKAAEQTTVARMQAIAQAEEFVKPYVGKLTVAMDRADAVYGTALEVMGIDIKDIHPSAYKAILSAQPKPGEQKRQIAADSSMPASMSELCPNFNRLQSA